MYNAAGGILWATIYGVAAYLLGSRIATFSTPVNVALVVIGIAAVIAVILFLRANEARLEKEAERAMPGPLEKYRKTASR
jgi:membrane protein DedA with SNARE-associated domain